MAHLNITIFIIELRSPRIENLAVIINQFLVNKLAQFQVSARLVCYISQRLVVSLNRLLSRSSFACRSRRRCGT